MNPVGSEKPQERSCTLCSKRKVKCDKKRPCSSCVKRKTCCTYPTASLRRSVGIFKNVSDESESARIRRYEGLLKRNNITFSRNDGWVQSGYETQLREQFQASGAPSGDKKGQITPIDSPAHGDEPTAHTPSIMWANLSDELRHPWRAQFKRSSLPGDWARGLSAAKSIQSMCTPEAPSMTPVSLSTNHPEPTQALRLLQIFVDRVNPLLKIVHAPSLQQQLLESSQGLNRLPEEMSMLMFAIYSCALKSMSTSECLTLLRTEKSILLDKYQIAVRNWLLTSGLEGTHDLVLLQAFALYLVSAPRSKSSYLASGIAVRVAQNLGQELQYSVDLPFFENEMRIRLWWNLVYIDSLYSRINRVPALARGLSCVRLPLNVDDTSLHPKIGNSPLESPGLTEMIFCLLRCETYRFFSRSSNAELPPGGFRALLDAKVPLSTRDHLIDSLEKIYEQKYLSQCDPSIPLHEISVTYARLLICKMRFTAHHPRRYPDGGASIPPSETDALFSHSVRLIELYNITSQSSFSWYFPLYNPACSGVDALIYAVSDLRRRTKGALVERAWRELDTFLTNHPIWIDDLSPRLQVAMQKLILEAWTARESDCCRDGVDITTPQFVARILGQSTSGAGDQDEIRLPLGMDSLGLSVSRPESPNMNPPELGLELNTNIDWSFDWKFWEGLLEDQADFWG